MNDKKFKDEVKVLGDISTGLLQRLEPEPSYVKEYIEQECDRLQEQGWFERDREEGWIRTFERETYTLRVAFIHARKGEHITGADLVFELRDKKIILIQSKRVGLHGRIHFNRFQLIKLIDLESEICGFSPLYLGSDIHTWIDAVHDYWHRLERRGYFRHLPPVPVFPFLPTYFRFIRLMNRWIYGDVGYGALGIHHLGSRRLDVGAFRSCGSSLPIYRY